MDRVDAVFDQPHAELRAVLRGQAVGQVLVGRDPVDDREVGADLGADGVHDVEGEAGPPLGVTTVFVGAVVGVWRQELVDQVAVGAVHLDGVNACFLTPARAGGELGHEFADLGGGQLAGHHLYDAAGDRRRCHQRGTGIQRVRLSAAVQELDRDPASGVVYGIGKLTQAWDRLVSVATQLPRRNLAPLVDEGAAGDV